MASMYKLNKSVFLNVSFILIDFFCILSQGFFKLNLAFIY